jgi:hypothetical protein
VEETTVRVPEQAARGTMLRLLVGDADLLNRASRGFAFAGAGSGPNGLDQLIAFLNRERRNDRLYVGLFVPAPTLLWDDKELPNIPLPAVSRCCANRWQVKLPSRSEAPFPASFL